MGLTFASLFRGLGGFDLGFERAGMTCKWQCEIDPKANAVAKRHWPNIPTIEDVRNVTAGNAEPVDLICGGFPCQDLSVAGKRAGLAGERSGLWFEYHRILSELKPQWVVIENVPGLLSSNRGRDFAVLLRGLAELRYLPAWRVLDAQYFGVPQRRRRVFIVASLGDGRAAEVLFERESLPGDIAPSRETGQGTSRDLTDGAPQSKRVYSTDGVAPTLNSMERRNGQSRDAPWIAFSAGNSDKSYGIGADENVTPPIRAGASGTNQAPTAAGSFGVRRLTPTECERLQGFPDGWTAYTADGKPQADSSRYRQLGNAVAVPVIEWIGRRIVAASHS